MANNSNKIIKYLDKLYPNVKCELKHSNNFQFLIAVVLSAQTTDDKVNKVTPILFLKYPNALSLSKAKLSDVENIIKPLGLYRNKAKNIIELSKILNDKYKGRVINDRDVLESLPGVGRKTCNVVLNNCFNVEAIGVDTHIARICKRLAIADIDDNPFEIEQKLMTYFPKSKWGKLHHQFIFFGRYKCKAIKPVCEDCCLKNICNYFE